jgi:hypothetical protein
MDRARHERRARGHPEKNEGSVRSARQVESVADRARPLVSGSRLVSASRMTGPAAAARAEDLVIASEGHFSAIVLRVRGRALRVRGMRTGSRDRKARKASVLHLHGSEPIARTKRAARVRSGSFVEDRGNQVEIADHERSVRSVRGAKGNVKEPERGQRSHFVHALKASRSRFVRGVRVNARDLHRVQRGHTRHEEKVTAAGSERGRQSRFGHALKASRSHIVRGVKVIARGLRRVHRGRTSRGEKVIAEDIRRGNRSHFVRAVKASRSHIVHGVKVNARDLHRVQRDRTSREQKVIAGPEAGLRFRREMIDRGVKAKEGRARSGRVRRVLQGRNLVERRSLAASRSLVATGSFRLRAVQAERAGLEASRSRSLGPRVAVSRVARRVDRGRAILSRGLRRRSSCEA